MKYSFNQKGILILLTLGIITFLIIKLFNHQNKAIIIQQEMMAIDKENNVLDESVNRLSNENIIDGVMYDAYNTQEGLKGLKGIGDMMNKGFDKAKKDLAKPFQALKDTLLKPINDIIGAIDKVKNFFNNIRDGFKEINQGIELEFINLGKSIKLGFYDIFNVVGTFGECGINTLVNIRTCILWYILDLIGTTLYNVIVRLPVFTVQMITGFNLQPFVDIVNCSLEKIDMIFYDLTCNHIFHFPDWVNKLCYTCKYEDAVNDINYDFKVKIPKLMQEPVDKFNSAANHFKRAFGI